MTRLPVDESNTPLRDALTRVTDSRERVTLSRDGRDVAVVVSLNDFALLEAMEDLLDLADANTAIREFKASGEATIPYEAVRRAAGPD